MKDLALIQEIKPSSVGRRCRIVANEKSEMRLVLEKPLWKALNVSNRTY